MINFQYLDPTQRSMCQQYLQRAQRQGCEYSFVNLYLWGRQKVAFLHGHMVFFSQFNRKSVYLFPIGAGEKKPVLDALMADARERGIPFRVVGLNQTDCALLEQLYPGKFQYHFDRDSFDYVYAIDDLADLKGRKFQRKRNHLNRFRESHPDYLLEPITEENVSVAAKLVESWYQSRQEADPHADYQMEKAALAKALQQRETLGLEGLLLSHQGQALAMTMGSQLNEDTFDIHFEKALDMADGAYAAINNGFAQYLREKHPQIRWLNREEDMGLEGLRKAKLSYNPDHMVEKSWAHLLEDGHDY